jgi:hypothetical protein
MASIKQNFSTRLVGLLGNGGSHSIKSAILEQSQNGIDAEARNLFIGYSKNHRLFINSDDGTGADDIEKLWGVNSTSKGKNKIGKKSTGELGGNSKLLPENIEYLSKYNGINTQHAYVCMKKIADLVKQPGMHGPEADEKIQRDKLIDVNEICQDNERGFTVDDKNRLLSYVETSPQLTEKVSRMIQNDPSQSGFFKVMKFAEDSTNFVELMELLPVLVQEMNLSIFNAYLRKGLTIHIIDLDNPENNINLDTNSASQVHILGKESIKSRPGLNRIPSPDFGFIDANRVHMWTISSYQNGVTVSEYNNFEGMFMKFETANGYKVGKDRSIEGELISQVRCYIAKVRTDEREEQNKMLGGLTKDELKRPNIMLNAGGDTLGLCRSDLPKNFKLSRIANMVEIASIICSDGENENFQLSACKSNFDMKNMPAGFLKILNDSIGKIMKYYDYNNFKTPDEEASILEQREKFEKMFYDVKGKKPKAETTPRRKPLTKDQVIDILEDMEADQSLENKTALLKILETNASFEQLKQYTLQCLNSIDGNPIIVNGCLLTVIEDDDINNDDVSDE